MGSSANAINMGDKQKDIITTGLVTFQGLHYLLYINYSYFMSGSPSKSVLFLLPKKELNYI